MRLPVKSATPQRVKLVALMLVVGTAAASLDPAQAQSLTRKGVEPRIALVIGNNNYQYAPKLENAVADARAIRREVEARGFQAVYRENATRRTMNDAVEEFLGKLSTDAVGMVYFSGHGVQIRSANYLIPTDLRADKESDVVYDGLDLGRLLDRMAQVQPRFSLVVIDACRDNPFHGRSIGGSKGLAPPMSNAEGVMVVYAAGANQEALDRLDAHDSNPNGLFTREFIKAMRTPGLNVQDMVSQVKLAVIQQAKSVGHVQTPAVYDQSVGTFVFSEGRRTTAPVVPAVVPAVVPEAAPAPAIHNASLGGAPPHLDLAAVVGALSVADSSTLTAASPAPATIEEALRQRSGDGKSSIARRFFENSTHSSEAIGWFDSALARGVDPNMTVPDDYYAQEGVLLEAMRAGNFAAIKALLHRGASPHAYQNLFLTTSPRPRFLFPLRFIADDDRFTLGEKQDLAKAFLDAGAVIPRPVPPTGGSGWKSTMFEVNDLQDKVAPKLGIKLTPTPTLCEQPAPPLCHAASHGSEDWCAIVAATPKKLNFVYGRSSGSPIYDVTLVYLLGIEGGRAYYLGLTKSITWDYVLVEVAKDASSWVILQMMSPESGMGLCKKDDSGYQPEACWRRIPLERVASKDEMRFDDWGLSWKIAKDSCTVNRPN
jgi:Caspase domain